MVLMEETSSITFCPNGTTDLQTLADEIDMTREQVEKLGMETLTSNELLMRSIKHFKHRNKFTKMARNLMVATLKYTAKWLNPDNSTGKGFSGAETRDLTTKGWSPFCQKSQGFHAPYMLSHDSLVYG